MEASQVKHVTLGELLCAPLLLDLNKQLHHQPGGPVASTCQCVHWAAQLLSVAVQRWCSGVRAGGAVSLHACACIQLRNYTQTCPAYQQDKRLHPAGLLLQGRQQGAYLHPVLMKALKRAALATWPVKYSTVQQYCTHVTCHSTVGKYQSLYKHLT